MLYKGMQRLIWGPDLGVVSSNCCHMRTWCERFEGTARLACSIACLSTMLVHYLLLGGDAPLARAVEGILLWACQSRLWGVARPAATELHYIHTLLLLAVAKCAQPGHQEVALLGVGTGGDCAGAPPRPSPPY